tara:strand:+ start:137 stop:883 length:747 start_codon:yes stop_codon:yes gene_type:complete
MKTLKVALSLALAIILVDSLISISDNRNRISGKLSSYVGNSDTELNQEWADKIMQGGYILHFRHAERQKWIDVEMYDSLESDVHNNGLNQSRMAENDYFKWAVCLNERGLIQARAIGEHLENIKFPIGYVISSPSCRSRQTADLSFGGYDDLDRDLVHRGPYNQKEEDHAQELKELYASLPVSEDKNTIVSAHNSVVHPDMFIRSYLPDEEYKLEEGGFYIISKAEEGLVMEFKFHNFGDFIRIFYPR